MHDPMTVAFEIKSPFFWKKYRSSIITIWHVDPELDGSDDSCGWCYPKLTKDQLSTLGHLAFCESQNPWFQRDPVKRISSAADAESLMRGAILAVSHCLKLKFSWEQICLMACNWAHNLHDNFQGSLCHLPMWHTNFKNDSEDERKRHAYDFFSSVAKILLREKRPWWKHPKWHVRHWKIVFAPVQKLKRWLFSRCSICGKRFKYGECPVSGNWYADGPKWFRSEEGVRHSECSANTKKCNV